MNDICIIVLDSCRYDTFAESGCFKWLGSVEKRWSWSGWTVPSHLCMLYGLMPHHNDTVHASMVYEDELASWERRAGAAFESGTYFPKCWLPTYLGENGYKSVVVTTVPCLNEESVLNAGVDVYEHVSFAWNLLSMRGLLEIVGRVRDERSLFALLNCSDTHYPYGLRLPRVSGLRGASEGRGSTVEFSDDDYERMYEAQVEAVRKADECVMRWCERLERDVSLIVTSDHGEILGEDGFFGHGPFVHDKVFEVPFVEGLV